MTIPQSVRLPIFTPLRRERRRRDSAFDLSATNCCWRKPFICDRSKAYANFVAFNRCALIQPRVIEATRIDKSYPRGMPIGMIAIAHIRAPPGPVQMKRPKGGRESACDAARSAKGLVRNMGRKPNGSALNIELTCLEKTRYDVA